MAAAVLLIAGLALTTASAPVSAGAPVPSPRDPHGGLLPKGNGVWMYDSVHAGAGYGQLTLPGMWAPELNSYNQAAGKGHGISVLFSYGTDVEMYCPDLDPTQCTPDDLDVYYTPDGSGAQSTQAYAEHARVIGARPVVSPVIDGRVGADYLTGFNDLSPSLARSFADKVAAQVCADPRVDGIQFDIEPFDISTANGQYYFYLQIAKDFAGAHGNGRGRDPYRCVGPEHPQGRFFSIFTFARSIQAGTVSATHMQQIVNGYHNGYVIDSLYDLADTPGGTFNPVAAYTSAVDTEVANMKSWADMLKIPYGMGIPAASSAHEYSQCVGPACQPASAGAPMLEYTQAALAAMDAHSVRADHLYLGTDVWDLSSIDTDSDYNKLPATAPSTVLSYLQQHL
ncbi:hypothetical protein [Rugosimonospora acidiphila]|uniref:hypothetical protein n=1 Tax=Rugosimonospora acidiphila TaxID=556531 RepID=UPI0031EFF4A1